MLGFGLYHTSVGFFDLEFSYGGHDEDSAGTVVVLKGNSAGLKLKESILVGKTYFNLDEINSITNYFGHYWTGIQYDPFNKNCNHFTEAFVKYICDMGQCYYPSYVNRFTKMGTLFRMWFYPLKEMMGNIVNYDDGRDISEGDFNRESQDVLNLPYVGKPSQPATLNSKPA